MSYFSQSNQYFLIHSDILIYKKMSFIIIPFNKNILNALNHNNQKFGFGKIYFKKIMKVANIKPVQHLVF